LVTGYSGLRFFAEYLGGSLESNVKRRNLHFAKKMIKGLRQNVFFPIVTKGKKYKIGQ
jgi:hypothetical protein